MQNELCKFHKSWSDQENLLLLLLVRNNISNKNGGIFQWDSVFQIVERIVQVSVFEELQKLVEKHRQQTVTGKPKPEIKA